MLDVSPQNVMFLKTSALFSSTKRSSIFVRDYKFLPFSRNMGKNISKNISSKYSQKILHHAKKYLIDALKLIEKEPFKNQQKQMGI